MKQSEDQTRECFSTTLPLNEEVDVELGMVKERLMTTTRNNTVRHSKHPEKD
jgi:hypothetical protein